MDGAGVVTSRGRGPRVLHVIDQLEQRGGAETSLLALLPRLAASGQKHAVMVLRGRVPDGDHLRSAGVGVLEVQGPGSRLSNIRAVRRAMRLFSPDLIHSTLFEADLAARLAGAVDNVPVLISIVNASYGQEARSAERVPAWKLGAVRAIDRTLARVGTAHFHAISDSARRHAVEHLRIDPGFTTVIPRGRDPLAMGEVSAARRSTVRRRLGWLEDQPVVINVAREEPQKDHAALVAAFAQVAVAHPDALLVLVGRRGRASDAVDAAIRSSGVSDRIIRLGVRDDVADLLAAADVFVLSSRYEGLGGVVVEAAAMRLPVVTTAVPAVLEVVGPNYPWVVPVRDVEALAARMSAILATGPANRDRIGRQLRRRFEERFELGAAVSATADLYEYLYWETRGHARLRRCELAKQVRTASRPA